MITRAQNELMCRVGPGTRMGAMLREYWHPVLRTQKLKPAGAPERIQLLGRYYVAFRTTDGEVAVLDERCPHRCTSLALARNEGDGLRCIFHGWKVGACGKVLEVPTEQPERAEAFAARVKVHHYPVREAGGLIWMFPQDDKAPPQFPDMEFTHLPDAHVDIRIARVHCNWIQAFEAVIDSAHLGILHSSSGMQRMAKIEKGTRPARFEVDFRQYGFREAALRERPDGSFNARIREFIAPYSSFPPGDTADGTCLGAISVPLDDEWSAQIWVSYNVQRPLSETDLEFVWRYIGTDRDEFRGDLGGFHNMWGQDREAMDGGHWTGFVGHPLLHEDFIVQEAMGPIVDRTQEHLSASDVVIAAARRRLLKAVKDYEAGAGVWGQPLPGERIDYNKIRSIEMTLGPKEDWRSMDTIAVAERQLAELRGDHVRTAAE